jgi:predicted unusual protein kinase regulating ubiquinone biosynthesis (AarF/ABC1/UbiB family)
VQDSDGELNPQRRHNEMFRLRVEQDDEGSLPRVFSYCTEEVLVNELVSGTWMWSYTAVIRTIRSSGI